MRRLHPTFQKQIPEKSGIAHHMLFHTPFVREMMDMAESCHLLRGGKPFWRLFLETVQEHLLHPPTHLESGASEYEMYFNFMLAYHRDRVELRELKWMNIPHRFVDHLALFRDKYGFDYVSLCWYL
jgi:hypothetical protein